MGKAVLDHVVGRLRILALAQPRTATESTDYLQQFVQTGDEAAFAALVERHRRLVWYVCWQELRHVHDAEDAFQAVFLVLARNAHSIRDGRTLSGWLYQVSRRVARKAAMSRDRRRTRQRSAQSEVVVERDDLSWRELQALLETELQSLPEKYRLPFLLCCVEGKTGAQAAQQLGWKEGTVSGRLCRARKLLQTRLSKRGISLAAVLAVWELGKCSAPAALVPMTLRAALSSSTSHATAAGLVSSRITELAQGVSRNMLFTKTKLLLSTLLVLPLLCSVAGLLIKLTAAEPPATPRPQETQRVRAEDKDAPSKPVDADQDIDVKGVVVGPDGKPVAGAQVLRPKGEKYVEEQVTGKDGKFHFKLPKKDLDQVGFMADSGSASKVVAKAEGFGLTWSDLNWRNNDGELRLSLVKDDVPLSGRIVDRDGKPLVGAKVSVGKIYMSSEDDLTRFLKAWKSEPTKALAGGKGYIGETFLSPYPLWYASRTGLIASETTDKEGRFKVAGLGTGRIVDLVIQGDNLAQEEVHIVMKKGVDDKDLNTPEKLPEKNLGGGAGPARPRLKLYGASFEHRAEPTKPIEGTITDKKSGKALADIQIVGLASQSRLRSFDVETATDDKGHFSLVGLPKDKEYRLVVFQKPNHPTPTHVSAVFKLTDTEGLKTLNADVQLERGVTLEGKLIDKTTGKPVRGQVQYVPVTFDEDTEVRLRYADTHLVDDDGVFRVAIPRGRGIIAAGSDAGLYGTTPVEDIDTRDIRKTVARNHLQGNAFELVEPAESIESLKLQVELTAWGKKK